MADVITKQPSKVQLENQSKEVQNPKIMDSVFYIADDSWLYNLISNCFETTQCIFTKRVRKSFMHFKDKCDSIYNTTTSELNEHSKDSCNVLASAKKVKSSLKKSHKDTKQLKELLLKLFESEPEIYAKSSLIMNQLLDTQEICQSGFDRVVDTFQLHCNKSIPETRRGLRCLNQLKEALNVLQLDEQKIFQGPEDPESLTILQERLKEQMETAELRKGFLWENLRQKISWITEEMRTKLLKLSETQFTCQTQTHTRDSGCGWQNALDAHQSSKDRANKLD